MTTTHYKTALFQTACGATSSGIFFCYSEARHEVTCRRCLASLAKRDRAFQRKARAFILARQAKHVIRWFGTFEDSSRYEAARAIAREEGRAS